MENEIIEKCEECGQPMEWKEDETECNMCDGYGTFEHEAGQVIVKCRWCNGTGLMEISGWFCPDCD